MRVLILGSGGREHALAWAMAESPMLTALYAAPGNPGIAEMAICIAIDPMDSDAVAAWCRAERIDLVVVGPEAPLAAGVADRLATAGIACFGPTAAAAQLEASKTFTKEICDACDAPTAAWARFTEIGPALVYLEARGAPIVIKADGLAAGKGVTVAETAVEAEVAVRAILGGRHGMAGTAIVIEDFMAGEEASLFVLSDGQTVLPLVGAQDHKRAEEGDLGPNTGGMGAYSPAPVLTPAVEAAAMDRIIRPVIAEMARRGTPFRGVLYAGLMIEDGVPRLVEFNVRFGDPECQVLMLRLKTDLLPVLAAAASGGLAGHQLDWRWDPAVCVVMAARGYPGGYGNGEAITGIAAAQTVPGVTVFQAGTASAANGQILSAGGRVLNICATGETVEAACARAYRAVDLIDWPGGFVRRDIAWRVREGSLS
ncbi:MAG: phosphoribosylamine--glycine ligase [Pseudomonadota bacterium]